MAITRRNGIELLDLPDCEALMENGKCACLRVPSCLGKGCAFFHPRDSDKKTFARLRTLDDKAQARIAEKYCDGHRPWMEAASGKGARR